MTARKVLFVNTYPPVVPLYEDSFPLMERRGVSPVALVSESQYRDTGRDHSSVTKRFIRIPRILRSNRRAAALVYWMIAPFVLIFGRYHEVVMLTQPPLFFSLGALIARLRGKPYCIHVMDMYPDLLAASGNRMVRLFCAAILPISKYALRNARLVIAIGRCMQDRLLAAGVSEDQIALVPNWPDVSLCELQASGDKFREQHGLGSKFLIMYSGNMGNFHSFDSILAVAGRYSSNDDLVFVFIGSGPRRSELVAASESLGNVILLGHQVDSEFADVLAAGNLHFVSLRGGFEGLMVPSKFYGILAAGRPVLYEGSGKGEVARVIVENRAGVVVEPNDLPGIEAVIEMYSGDPDRCTEDGYNARRAYEQQYERGALAERYSALFAG